MEVRKIRPMTESEIKDTSKRVQMWLNVIAKNERIQRLADAKDVRMLIQRERSDFFITHLDFECISHAIEVSPVKCSLTKKYHEQWKR